MRKTITQCAVCGAAVQPKTITYTQQIAGKVYVVADVPAEVCPQCGQQYLTPETVAVIQEAIERGTAHEAMEVPVYHFPSR